MSWNISLHLKMQTVAKLDNFDGQRAIVLPQDALEVCHGTSPINSLYITDIGLYPRAAFHYCDRPNGTEQNILIYCTEGRGWVNLPNGHFEIHPNEFIIIPQYTPHTYAADQQSPWTIYWAHFGGNLAMDFSSMLLKHGESFVKYSPFVQERIRIFESICTALEAGYSLDNLTFSNLSFSYFLTALGYTEKFTSSEGMEKDSVDKSIEYMGNNLHLPLTLKMLAGSANLSESHYATIFRKKKGYSPMVFFNRLKVQRACQYLKSSALRINEIAYKVGIQDPFYFSRMFTKTIGISPAEYRKKAS